MSRKYKKYSSEFKLQAVKECEEGATFYSVDKKYGLSLGTTGKWFAYYKAYRKTLSKGIPACCAVTLRILSRR